MTDTPTRIVGIGCVLLGVWVVTYWVYKPAGPRISADDPLPRQPRAPIVEPVAKPLVVQPPPVSPPQPQPPQSPRTRKVQKVLPPEFRSYTLQKGDTSFERIAARREVFGDSTKGSIIARANPMVSPDRLKVGDTVLKIPLDPENIQGKLVWVDEPIPDAPPIVAPEPVSPPPVPKPEAKTYTIQAGDTLWTIAEKQYGKGAAWRTIAEANRDVLPDPDRPKVGVTLKIPPAPAR